MKNCRLILEWLRSFGPSAIVRVVGLKQTTHYTNVPRQKTCPELVKSSVANSWFRENDVLQMAGAGGTEKMLRRQDLYNWMLSMRSMLCLDVPTR